ncbi:14363_t:CDS:2, partial [Dentiscutata erythropus]
MSPISDTPTIISFIIAVCLFGFYFCFYSFYRNGVKAALSFLSTLCIVVFVIYTLLLFFIIPYVSDNEVEKLRDKIFYFPTYNKDTKRFECNSSLDYSEIQSEFSHTTIVDQISGFGTIAILLFNVAVYGVTSRLSFRNTCIVDDLVDLVYFFILSTVITRSISSFFSHDKDIKVIEILKHGFRFEKADNGGISFYRDPYKFVFLAVLSEEHTSRLLGQQRLYLNVDLEDDKSSFIKNFQKSYLKFYLVFYLKKHYFTKSKKLFDQYPNEDVDKKIYKYIQSIKGGTKKIDKDIINIPGLRRGFFAKKLIKYAIIYMNILETGIFQYFTYSHRTNEEKTEDGSKDSKKSKKIDVDIKDSITIEKKEDSKDHKTNKNSDESKKNLVMYWLVIPDIYEFDNDVFYNCKKKKESIDIEQGSIIDDIDDKDKILKILLMILEKLLMILEIVLRM